MHKRSDALLIVACLVVGLTMLFFHGSHPVFMPQGWASTCGRSVSLPFAVHMAELEARRIAANVGRFVSFA